MGCYVLNTVLSGTTSNSVMSVTLSIRGSLLDHKPAGLCCYYIIEHCQIFHFLFKEPLARLASDYLFLKTRNKIVK